MATTDRDSQYRLITKPAEGKDPWATDYYDFVDTADEELVPQGTIDDRDATNPHDGALWYVIDGSDEYLSRYDANSSSWIKATAEADNHSIGSSQHDSDTLANLNSKISDATLDDAGDKRTPEDHDNASHTKDFAVDGDKQPPETHSISHEDGGTDEISVDGLSGDLADPQDAKAHSIGGSTHNSDTLANLNSKLSDATLDDSSSERPPSNHGNSSHSETFLTELDTNTPVTGDVDFGSHLINFDTSWSVGTLAPDEGDRFVITDGTTRYFKADQSDAELGGDVIRFPTGEVVVENDGRVNGDFFVSGNKDFQIPHPSQDGKTLRHGTYEGPVGGGLIYRDQVEVVDGTANVDFPDYILSGEFGTDWVQSVTPKEHFGTGYLNTETWTIHAESDGIYDVILMGQRNDNPALSGQGGITTKDKDESWNGAADRFYGGDDDIDGNEVAVDDDEYRQTTLHAHAKSQYKEDDN